MQKVWKSMEKKKGGEIIWVCRNSFIRCLCLVLFLIFFWINLFSLSNFFVLQLFFLMILYKYFYVQYLFWILGQHNRFLLCSMPFYRTSELKILKLVVRVFMILYDIRVIDLKNGWVVCDFAIIQKDDLVTSFVDLSLGGIQVDNACLLSSWHQPVRGKLYERWGVGWLRLFPY